MPRRDAPGATRKLAARMSPADLVPPRAGAPHQHFALKTQGAAAGRISSRNAWQGGEINCGCGAHPLVRNHWSRPGRCFLPCRTDAAIIGFAQGGQRGKAAFNFRRPIAGLPIQLLLVHFPKAAFDELGKCVDGGLGITATSAQC